MIWRNLLYSVLILIMGTEAGRAQSSITTVLGASLNDIPRFRLAFILLAPLQPMLAVIRTSWFAERAR